MQLEIISKIKIKKPLDRLDDEFVQKFLDEFYKKNSKFKNKELKQREIKNVVKKVRNELNKVYGQFWLNNKLDLKAHKSTKERINTYKELYKELFKITGKPNSILDISAGLNPLAYPKGIYYIATELTELDCSLIKKCFKDNKINGEVLKIDILKEYIFPKADITFMFKLLDLVSHKDAERLLTSMKSKYIVVSFSTVTTRNKKMNYPRRGWFERLLTRLDLDYKKLHFENEMFYVITST